MTWLVDGVVLVWVEDDGGVVVVCVDGDDDGGAADDAVVDDGGWLVSEGWLSVELCEPEVAGADVLAGPVLTLGAVVVGAAPPVCRSAIMIAAAIASSTKAAPITSTGGRRYHGTPGRSSSRAVSGSYRAGAPTDV